jgi:hypothetical protein
MSLYCASLSIKSFSSISTLIFAFVCTNKARDANCRVDLVSETDSELAFTVATRVDRAFPFMN